MKLNRFANEAPTVILIDDSPPETQFPNTQLAETQLPETQFPNTQLAESQFSETQFADTQLPATQFADTHLPATQFAETAADTALVPPPAPSALDAQESGVLWQRDDDIEDDLAALSDIIKANQTQRLPPRPKLCVTPKAKTKRKSVCLGFQ